MKIKILLRENYLVSIKNSIGTRLFRNLWVEADGVKKDILEDGELSCAQFVSGLLYLQQMINSRHATVEGTLKDLEASGWHKIAEPKEGCILVWEKVDYPDGTKHSHIGFYVGNQKAISNRPIDKSPQEHYWTYARQNEDEFRKISSMYWHDSLN